MGATPAWQGAASGILLAALVAGCSAPTPIAGPADPVFTQTQPNPVDPDAASEALLRAAKHGMLDEVRQLAETSGVNLELSHFIEMALEWETSGYTPLAFAAYRGDVAMFDYLLSRGAQHHPIVLIAAAHGGQLALVRRLVELGVDEPGDLTFAMGRACMFGERAVVEYLLEVGAQIDGFGLDGETKRTCLMEAAWSGDLELVEYLIDAGANVDQADEAGFTPLMDASGDLEILERLAAHGADVTVTAESDWTPLHIATRDGDEGRMAWLIDHGAKVDARDEYGMTPLMEAARYDQLWCTKLLLASGADVHAENGAGKRAVDLASEGSEVHAILLEETKR
jgi:ankyrin repeat protein